MTSKNEAAKGNGAVFWTAFVGFQLTLFLTLIGIEVSVILGPREDFGLRPMNSDRLGLSFMALNLFLSSRGADLILKWFGLSRSGTTREVWGRAVAISDGEVADKEVIEVRIAPPITTALLVLWVAGNLLLAFGPYPLMSRSDWFLDLNASFGLGVGLCFFRRQLGRPLTWADASGIMGYPGGFHLRRRFVPWSRIETCEIATHHDLFGKPSLIRPSFEGREGESLMTLDLRFTRMHDQVRLTNYIKARLPKPGGETWA